MRPEYSQVIVTCIHDQQGIVANTVDHDGAPPFERQRTIEDQTVYDPMVVHSMIRIRPTS